MNKFIFGNHLVKTKKQFGRIYRVGPEYNIIITYPLTPLRHAIIMSSKIKSTPTEILNFTEIRFQT